MRRYTYQDLVLSRKQNHSYTKKIENDVKTYLNEYKSITDVIIYKILISKYKQVPPLELLTIIQNTIKKGGC